MNEPIATEPTEPIHVLSLGAGVQSSTLALMAAHGEVTPMPVAAVFADTQAEPGSVYRWLDWLEKQLPFPVRRVMYGQGLTAAIERSLKTGSISASPPWFSDDGTGRAVIMKRACTRDFKIEPVQKEVRRLSGAKRGATGLARLWIGISTDEYSRIKPSRYPHMTHRWPLIEMNMSRADCLSWMKAHGYAEPPKSSCVYCPFHSDTHWRSIRDNDPDGWAEAVRIDRLIRIGVRRNGRAPMFAHRSLKPLNEVDLRTETERGQLLLWNNECEGMCGV